jgi:hypothetical protein
VVVGKVRVNNSESREKVTEPPPNPDISRENAIAMNGGDTTNRVSPGVP